MNQPNKNSKKTTSGFAELTNLFPNDNNKIKNTKNTKNKHDTVKKQNNTKLVDNKNSKTFLMCLTRKVNVKQYPVIATICLLQKRPDIVSLLNQSQEKDINLPIRLTSYLKKEDLLDNEYALTDKAKEVLSSGKMPIYERGLYHIWYTENDPLLGTRPLLIQRDNAFKEPKYKELYKGLEAEHSEFSLKPSKNNEKALTVKFSGSEKSASNRLESEDIISILPTVICAATDNKILNLTWDLSFERSNIKLEGPLNILSGHDLKNTSQVDFEYSGNENLSKSPEIYSSIATHLGGQWIQKTQRISVPFTLTKQHQGVLSHFILNNYPEFSMACNYGNFDHVNLQKLPVQPIQDEATQWHLAWLEGYLSRGFKETEVAHADQLFWIDQPALKQCNLKPLLGNNLITALSREKSPRAYWQYSAIHDLTPSLSSVTALPLTLIDKELVDINQLIKMLSMNKPCINFIYSDRYIVTKQQQLLLSVITQSINSTNISIFTDEKHIKKLATNSPNNWNIESFYKGVENHDRYWIFQAEDHITAWKCTVSLDFLTNNDESYYANGYPTFTPIVIEQLPEYLRNSLQNNTPEVIV
ncbi:MAG: hypothetical protein HRU38_20975 [Saccharospirillaceae bacterium]|nr:hypothetical protein [Pseudomonadales bacterium]NRB81105.1 hypothetical protein [Saccharospirillaceae bacterium]